MVPQPIRVAVIGHVEWVTHTRGMPPGRGLIADVTDPLVEAAGGGGVAAAAAARLGARCTLITAFGDDHAAVSARATLMAHGVDVRGAHRTGAQTPVLTITEPDGERTITVVGPRLQPARADDLGWADLAHVEAVYYTGEDPGTLAAGRAAPVLVVTGRRVGDLLAAGVRADVIVASAHDPDEDLGVLPVPLRPHAVILTDGARGGVILRQGAEPLRYPPAAAPGSVIDTYGCGDSFAAGLTVGLGQGLPIEAAVAMGARAGAACATWRGGLGPIGLIG